MFKLTKETFGHTTVLHCSGRIVLPEAEGLHTDVVQLQGIRKLVLDLADVVTIDSDGMGIFVSLYHWAKRTRTELKLMNVGSRVQRLLEIVHLDTVLEYCSAREMVELSYCLCDEAETSRSLDRAFTADCSDRDAWRRPRIEVSLSA